MESRFTPQNMELDSNTSNIVIHHFQTYIVNLGRMFHEIALEQKKRLSSQFWKQDEHDYTPIHAAIEQQEIFEFLDILEQLHKDPNQALIDHHLGVFNLIQKNSLLNDELRKFLSEFMEFIKSNLSYFPVNSNFTQMMIKNDEPAMTDDFIADPNIQMALENYYKNYKKELNQEDNEMEEMLSSFTISEEPQNLVQLMNRFNIYAKEDEIKQTEKNDKVEELRFKKNNVIRLYN